MERTQLVRRIGSVLALVALVSYSAHGAKPGAPEDGGENPYARANRTWISLSGTVDDVRADAFTLDYGEGMVTVEMDDGDRDADGYKLIEGDRVTVSGMIDDDFFETTTIEAGSVYVEKLGTTFHASPVDEEDARAFTGINTPIAVSTAMVQGTVTDVRHDAFTLDTGERTLTVEIDRMPYDPLDAGGYMRVRTGDVVQVTGVIDRDLFEGRELVASSIVKLYR